MSLVIGANTNVLRTYELQQVQILSNQALPTAGIMLLEVNWLNPPIEDYDTGQGGIGTIIWRMRWRLNNGNWTEAGIADGAVSQPLKPSFLGMQLDYLQGGPPPSSYNNLQPISGQGWYGEQWFLKGTPTTSGILEIQFAVNPSNLNNPFA
jgi:hypothetical protein